MLSCDMGWKIVVKKEGNSKITVKTAVDEEKGCYLYRETGFDFLSVEGGGKLPCIEIGARRFIFFPEYVIAAQSETDFDVIPQNFLELSYEKASKCKMVYERKEIYGDESEKNAKLKNAKLKEEKWLHQTKNGKRDERYANNICFEFYEWGELTFKTYGLTIPIGDAKKVEDFYAAVLPWTLDFNKENNVFELSKNETKGEVTDKIFGVTEAYFNEAVEATEGIKKFYREIKTDSKVLRALEQNMEMGQVLDPEEKLRYCLLMDLVNCYKRMGHDPENLHGKEGLPMVLAEGYAINETQYDFVTILREDFGKIVEGIEQLNATLGKMFSSDNEEHPENFYYMEMVWRASGMDKYEYFLQLEKLVSMVVKADNKITETENDVHVGLWSKAWDYYQKSQNHKGNDVGTSVQIRQDDPWRKKRELQAETPPLKELQQLIGLTEVKREVTGLANFVKIQKAREAQGMKPVGMSYHCVFTGNPGTGKTTVARILAAIYKDLGILKKGHLVETDRSGLVAEYVGQTAVKTNKIIDKALDSVLFIDEAYALAQGGGHDYGAEAVATLLKRMEDDRGRLIVVLAGYSDDMRQFIDMNPGLQSRFSRYIRFEDYSAEELAEIYRLDMVKNQYRMDERGENALKTLFERAVAHKGKNFGNGRFARNIFEKTIQNQAVRLASKPQVEAEELQLLTAEDLPENQWNEA